MKLGNGLDHIKFRKVASSQIFVRESIKRFDIQISQ